MIPRKQKWALKLAAVEFTYWFAAATFNYLTVFLEANGYSVAQVGVINTINSLAATLFSPVGGAIADKIRSSRKALVIFLVTMSVAYALVPFTARVFIFGISLMIIFDAMAVAINTPAQFLLETTVIKGCNNTSTDYGAVRVMGTIGFVIMSSLMGSFINSSNSYWTFFLLGISMMPCLYAVRLIKQVSEDEISREEKGKPHKLELGKLYGNPLFICYLIYTALQYIPQTAMQYYQPYLIREVGANMAFIGYLQAYRASFEIPTLMFSYKLTKKVSLKGMVIISSILFGIQSLLYGKVQTFPQVLAATTFSGLASGFLISGGVKYVNQIAPKELQQSAQTAVGSVRSLSGIIGSFVGALFIEYAGIRTFFVSTGVIMVIAAVFLAYSTAVINKKKKEL